MSTINGGARPGAGRKAAFDGEQTKPVRIPESQVSIVLSFLKAYRERKNNSKSASLTLDERFAYEFEIGRLKSGLADAIHYLQTAFRPIPVIRQKINTLQAVLDAPREMPLKRAFSTWYEVSKHYSPAGAPWELSGTVNDQKIVFLSQPPIPLPFSSKSTDAHQYALSAQEVDNLIEFLLNARQHL